MKRNYHRPDPLVVGLERLAAFVVVAVVLAAIFLYG